MNVNYRILECAIEARSSRIIKPLTDSQKVFLALHSKTLSLDELKSLSSEINNIPLTMEIAEIFHDCVYSWLNAELQGVYTLNDIIEAIRLYIKMIPELAEFYGKDFINKNSRDREKLLQFLYSFKSGDTLTMDKENTLKELFQNWIQDVWPKHKYAKSRVSVSIINRCFEDQEIPFRIKSEKKMVGNIQRNWWIIEEL